MSRIEDMTMNVLIGQRNQIFLEGKWKERLNCSIIHTGNALTSSEMEDLSANLNMIEIRNYRNTVGESTKSIMNELQFSDLSRSIRKSDLQRIANQGGVKEEIKNILDFWGSNAVAGLLYMPANFHNLHHLSESIRLKEKYHKEKKD
ncbi:hypothetical protein ACX1C1_19685 [Paenibacillus sp. strain BS8-2]